MNLARLARLASIQHVFLLQGFDSCHKGYVVHSRQEDMYEHHANQHNGFVGIVDDFYEHAWVIAKVLSTYQTQDFPGVYEYEITEGLGVWLFNHPEASIDDFQQHVAGITREWFRLGLAAHGDPASLLVPGSHVRSDPDELKLNATQPVVAKRGESTMQINDLISTLQRVRDDHGNVDVVVRGSKETSFVDVQEVRPVKTSKRQTVYIGKTSAKFAQE